MPCIVQMEALGGKLRHCSVVIFQCYLSMLIMILWFRGHMFKEVIEIMKTQTCSFFKERENATFTQKKKSLCVIQLP